MVIHLLHALPFAFPVVGQRLRSVFLCDVTSLSICYLCHSVLSAYYFCFHVWTQLSERNFVLFIDTG